MIDQRLLTDYQKNYNEELNAIIKELDCVTFIPKIYIDIADFFCQNLVMIEEEIPSNELISKFEENLFANNVTKSYVTNIIKLIKRESVQEDYTGAWILGQAMACLVEKVNVSKFDDLLDKISLWHAYQGFNAGIKQILNKNSRSILTLVENIVLKYYRNPELYTLKSERNRFINYHKYLMESMDIVDCMRDCYCQSITSGNRRV